MKHLYTLIFLLLVSTNIIAQEREFLPVNWKQIKEIRKIKDISQKALKRQRKYLK